MCVWWGCAQGRTLETMHENPKDNELEKTKDQWFPPSMDHSEKSDESYGLFQKKKIHIYHTKYFAKMGTPSLLVDSRLGPHCFASGLWLGSHWWKCFLRELRQWAMRKQHGMATPSSPLYTQVILCALEKGTTSGSLNQNKVPTSMGGWSEKVPALCGWCLTGLSPGAMAQLSLLEIYLLRY